MLTVMYITMFICGTFVILAQGQPKTETHAYFNIAMLFMAVFGFVGITYTLVS